MGLPAARDIDIYRGDDYENELTFIDNGDPPAALDLSAFTITAQFRAQPDATDHVAFAVDDSDAANGVIVISLTDAQTAQLPMEGFYDVQAELAGDIETLVRGAVTVTKDITRVT